MEKKYWHGTSSPSLPIPSPSAVPSPLLSPPLPFLPLPPSSQLLSHLPQIQLGSLSEYCKLRSAGSRRSLGRKRSSRIFAFSSEEDVVSEKATNIVVVSGDGDVMTTTQTSTESSTIICRPPSCSRLRCCLSADRSNDENSSQRRSWSVPQCSSIPSGPATQIDNISDVIRLYVSNFAILPAFSRSRKKITNIGFAAADL